MVINSFAHARYDTNVQHEIDIFSNRISIMNPGSFANNFLPEEFAERDLHSFLRNEVISKILYLCKDVETFGSGLRKIYTLCKDADISIGYINSEHDFTLEFSRNDRNITPPYDTINDTINEKEAAILSWLQKNPSLTIRQLAEKCQKSPRTVMRTLTSLKSKHFIERIGSNKTGYWKVK